MIEREAAPFEAAFFFVVCQARAITISCPVICCCYLLRRNLEGFSLRRFLILSVLALRIMYATSNTIMPITYSFMFPGAIISLH
jgi:hypothetical protein